MPTAAATAGRGGLALSLAAIFALAVLASAAAAPGPVREWGFESVFFAVLFGLAIGNTCRLPEWLRPAIQSEFYIKIGIVCLGSTILFDDVLRSGAYGLGQALVVVVAVWYFAFWI